MFPFDGVIMRINNNSGDGDDETADDGSDKDNKNNLWDPSVEQGSKPRLYFNHNRVKQTNKNKPRCHSFLINKSRTTRGGHIYKGTNSTECMH